MLTLLGLFLSIVLGGIVAIVTFGITLVFQVLAWLGGLVFQLGIIYVCGYGIYALIKKYRGRV